MSLQSVSSDYVAGQRVLLDGRHTGSFLRYGPPECACPASHVSSPGMRIVLVDVDAGQGFRGGVTPYWEDAVRPAECAAHGHDEDGRCVGVNAHGHLAAERPFVKRNGRSRLSVESY